MKPVAYLCAQCAATSQNKTVCFSECARKTAGCRPSSLSCLRLQEVLLLLCLPNLYSLCLVDGFNQHTLVLVLVTLGCAVEEMINVLVNLFGLPVLAQQTAKHTQTPHPKHLCRHACLTSSTTLAQTCMSSLSLGIEVLADPRSGVHLDRLAVDETILDELADVEARIGHGDL